MKAMKAALVLAAMIGAGSATMAVRAQSAPSQTVWTDEEFYKGATPMKAPGLVLPKLLKNVAPRYPREAMNEKIQGTVEVEMVVGIDGNVLRSRIKRSLDTKYGLDREALTAASLFTFEPGQLGGQRVPVVVTVELEFKLRRLPPG